jgi:hypothetical protein
MTLLKIAIAAVDVLAGASEELLATDGDPAMIAHNYAAHTCVIEARAQLKRAEAHLKQGAIDAGDSAAPA